MHTDWNANEDPESLVGYGHPPEQEEEEFKQSDPEDNTPPVEWNQWTTL